MTNNEQFNQAIILKVHYTGANMALATIFCEKFGLTKGIVKLAKKRQAELQKGNIIEYIHFKRTKDHLGTIKFNLLIQTFVKYFDNKKAIKNLNYINELLVKYLHQGIAYPSVFQATKQIFNKLDEPEIEKLILLYEYNLVKELGFSIDVKNYLKQSDSDKSAPFYISPKSGRVASENMGKSHHDKLLVIPHMYGGIEENNQIILAKKINQFLLGKVYK
ncbi:MAG: DNA repair protein RecO [Proteobacteria bacterium]|nr:DNA repair protein RecO [Pseudomonadota bacterium]